MRKKAVLTQLRAAHSSALFERASFGGVSGEKLTYQGKEYDVTEFIKEQTRLYMKSWIVDRIVFAINEIERDRLPKVVKQFVRKA